MRLDFVDPEAVLHQGARPAQQFFELPQGERPHLHQPTVVVINDESSASAGIIFFKTTVFLTRLLMWTIQETLPRGGEGWRAVRTGSSMVMETPVLCWLMERRTRASLVATAHKRQ